MVIIIAAFASILTYAFELEDPASLAVFAIRDNVYDNELVLVTASNGIESWNDIKFRTIPEGLPVIKPPPDSNVSAGQIVNCPDQSCTVYVIDGNTNTVIGMYKFKGPDGSDGDEDETDESEETDETNESNGSDDPGDIEGAIKFDIYKITPQTLNSRSSGTWITFYFSLPVGYYAADVEISTILLNGIVPIDEDTSASADAESSKFMVKFDRQEVIAILSPGDNVEVTVTGLFIDGTEWEGTDFIKVI